MRKLSADLGDLADEVTIRGKMDEMLSVAKGQMVSEG